MFLHHTFPTLLPVSAVLALIASPQPWRPIGVVFESVFLSRVFYSVVKGFINQSEHPSYAVFRECLLCPVIEGGALLRRVVSKYSSAT